MKKYMKWRIYNKIVGSICPNYKLTIRIKILKVNLFKISILWINRNALRVKLLTKIHWFRQYYSIFEYINFEKKSIYRTRGQLFLFVNTFF
jgi:hypothetical protein